MVDQGIPSTTVPTKFWKTRDKAGSRSQTSKSKYHLDTADLRLPPPVLCMSDFERHAQRKNKVIQANYDDELQKIGIDCKVSRKFLTSDARRFYCRISSDQRVLRGKPANTHDREDVKDYCHSKDRLSLPQTALKMSERHPNNGGVFREAWSTATSHKPKKSKKRPDKAVLKSEEEGSIFITDIGQTTPETVTTRILPQSAKMYRIEAKVIEKSPPRPKTTTPVRRHVTFWDTVDELMGKENRSDSKGKAKPAELGQSNEASQTNTHTGSVNNARPLSEICTDFRKKHTPSIKKDSQTHGTENMLSRKPVITSLSSFLHFDKLQASGELRRELRNNAESRKVDRRRRLSEILRMEKSSYNESLTKMASRLKDEKLLEFCRESCRGMDNVFNYNL